MRRIVYLFVLAAVLSSVDAYAAGKAVISHRGASAYLPEHTLEAYAVAHAMGVDYVEQDLVLTKDARFICLHDIHLEMTTNVEEVFPDRKREDGRWYAADFTLAEIKTLRAHERTDNRFPIGKSEFLVPTFEEAIELVQGMNKTTGREAGIYPELKEPLWHEKQGLPMEEAFLDIVARYGYVGKDAKIFVQCFVPSTLKKIRFDLKSELPQILLIGGGKTENQNATPEGLKEVAKYAEGIGPDMVRVILTPDLVKWAHEAGLQVHPYTLRADSLPSGCDTFDQELEQFYVKFDVDAVFTDFPDLAVQFLTARGLH
ncbi:MAG: Glycerophosphodiester phosphodiesterase [Candidatus Hydrogenedentes bacterium]|nr:Glycerophosphodiester phosphodiesterase [Candidatus Hydrogenedentota bacterium]